MSNHKPSGAPIIVRKHNAADSRSPVAYAIVLIVLGVHAIHMATVTDVIRSEDSERWGQIHDKDTYLCPDCGRDKSQHGRKWEVHHVNKEPHNIVGLCKTCHNVRHGADRKNCELDYWKEDFLALGE